MYNRIENPELKPYIIEFVTKKLEDCELFTQIYGKGFARRRLELNFQSIYTNAFDKLVDGCYNSSDLSITLCKSGEDGSLLSVEEFLKSEKIQEIVLHEAIHAIFNRLKSECKEIGISRGTGLFEVDYHNNQLGRGFNEGYTNWVCEKAGIKTNSYVKQLNFINILELAIGPENVMRMGKGNIRQNISDLFQMSCEDTKLLLAKGDYLNGLNRNINELILLFTTLQKKIDFDRKSAENPSQKMPENLKRDLKYVESMTQYIELMQNPEYISFAKDKNLDPESLECKKDYFGKCVERQQNLLDELQKDIEDILYSKFFLKEFDEIKESGIITPEQLKKFTALNKLIWFRGENDTTPISEFKRDFKKIKAHYFDQAIKSDIENGTFTLSKFEQYKDWYSARR